MLNQNSFQKNGLLKVNASVRANNAINNDKLGRRTLQEVRDDMWKAKENVNFNNREYKEINIQHDNQLVDHRKRVEDVRNLSRWNG